MERLSPIFLHTSWRTGGTALAAAVKSVDSLLLFYDPLNPTLENYEYSRDIISSGWDSNHPPRLSYFDSYLSLFEDGKLPGFPNLTNFVFRNSSKNFQNELLEYIHKLVNVAQDRGLTAIFKCEQLEGHVDLLRSGFPGSLHVGVTRDSKLQYQSWLEQLALGNSFFFESARKLIQGDSVFFEPLLDISMLTPLDVFEIYTRGIEKLRVDLDYVLELTKESFDGLLSSSFSQKHLDIFAMIVSAYNSVESPPTVDFKFERILKRSLSLVAERDQIAEERDRITQDLTQQRDQIAEERDRITQDLKALLNSTSWKVTKPIRYLFKFFNP
jgi:hypothetical protein